VQSAQQLPRSLQLPRLRPQSLLIPRNRLIDRPRYRPSPLRPLRPPGKRGVPLRNRLNLGEQGGGGKKEGEREREGASGDFRPSVHRAILTRGEAGGSPSVGLSPDTLGPPLPKRRGGRTATGGGAPLPGGRACGWERGRG
jgi:hypothetical protein